MTQHEFESRVGVKVSTIEYASIERVYMDSDVEKDEFCKLWSKMNRNRIAAIQAEKKAASDSESIPIDEKIIARMLELAQDRAAKTGSTLPVSDTEIDAGKIRACYDKDDSLSGYYVLRDTGAAIVHTLGAAMAESKAFGGSNDIYEFYGNRILNWGYLKRRTDLKR